MINVLIYAESRYRVRRQSLREKITSFLRQNGIWDLAEVCISIVGSRKIKTICEKYHPEDLRADVLAFSQSEGQILVNPDKILRLGDVVISYPRAIERAVAESVLVDEVIVGLAIHGVKHLLGIHDT